jgi:hypothetical protein
MTNQYSIIPPPDLVRQWVEKTSTFEYVANCAAQWGADQELEACCKVVSHWYGDWHKGIHLPTMLRAARRPKPPSLKEQAIAVLEDAELDAAHYNILFRALEQLND